MGDARPYPCRFVQEPNPKGPGARGYLQLHKFECPRARCPEAPQCAKCEKTKSPVLPLSLIRSQQVVVSISYPDHRDCWKFDWQITVSIRPSLEGLLQS